MWYQRLGGKNMNQPKAGLEETLAKSCIEHEVLRRMFLNGEADPSITRLNKLTQRALNRLKDKFGDFNSVHHHLRGENLTEAIKPVVDEVFTKRG